MNIQVHGKIPLTSKVRVEPAKQNTWGETVVELLFHITQCQGRRTGSLQWVRRYTVGDPTVFPNDSEKALFPTLGSPKV